VKYAFMKAHRTEFSVRVMCRVLKVDASGYYAGSRTVYPLKPSVGVV